MELISAGTIAALLLAPVIGSFLGVLVRRLPRGEGFARGRSRCEACGHPLGAAELVPIASFAIQRGRCRHCGGVIAADHLWIELAAIAVPVWAATVDADLRLAADCLLGWTLLALAWIDAEHMILPDLLTLPLVLAGLASALLAEPESLVERALGAVAGYLAFRLVEITYRRLRGRDGLGEGDAKLLAAGGAWVGWPGLGPVILIAALGGLAAALVARAIGRALDPTAPLPFGPFLAGAIWIVWLYWT